MESLIAIIIYMAGMLGIGYYSYKRTTDLSDYMLGGRNLGPAVTALSAGASDMSGWLMLGLPGAMFAQGISASWIVIGLTLGAYLNWLYVAPRLRSYTELANNSITIPAFLGNRFEDKSRTLRLVSGLVIIIFFTFYVSSGLVSGAVLFQNSFNVDYHTGLWIVGGVVVAYTLFGGFLAVSITDFVQGLIMVLALVMVPLVTIQASGGLGTSFNTIQSINPAYLDFFKGTTLLGIISLFGWGLGYFGQPHIIIRFMAISSIKEVAKARRIGMSWMVFSVVGAMFTGLVGIAYFANKGITLTDPETVFLELGKVLFHPIVTGLLLAAILAAIMSTISSQLLVTSSSLTEDLYSLFRRRATDKELVLVGRLCVLIVAVVAILIAYQRNDTILSLVGYAWAGFGSAFGPVILLSLYWKRMNKWGALAGMIAGSSTVILWTRFPFLKNNLYELVPGFFVCLIAIVAVSLLTTKPSDKMQAEFEQCQLNTNQL
ncbi:sodium/proline symporter PutP [Desulfosporosinus sp.]|uniref:sodium/proline symporter PutP n=1 Tax=Desulfosporosinus sp. TaxID=157907 RepID=UPI000E869B36|nr:sodium/proline symporter PutP [Desulfosporosinus sp.]MBC2721138.1 sodium/proline symporter PutP [Desulfosporosinus sp.]MBC2725539.1 sodium/proline symporter PutP [Desulfosporosinus sp.]HBV88198.1 sodium/proline symporter PutP [Desulfosporosinus sp.]